MRRRGRINQQGQGGGRPAADQPTSVAAAEAAQPAAERAVTPATAANKSEAGAVKKREEKKRYINSHR
jgi:hypothetical protein